MTTEPLPTGPDPEAIARTIRETRLETDVVEMGSAAAQRTRHRGGGIDTIGR